jgi:hypothetical protein
MPADQKSTTQKSTRHASNDLGMELDPMDADRGV